jgi:hypothetical protein
MAVRKKTGNSPTPVLSYESPTPPASRRDSIFEYLEWKDGRLILGGLAWALLTILSGLDGLASIGGVMMVAGFSNWVGRRPWW